MSFPSDYMVKCPQCDSDDIFTMHRTVNSKLPVSAVRECRRCKYKFHTKFDAIITDVVSLAKATTFKAIDDEVWSGLFTTGVYDTQEEAIEAQIAELVSEAK